METKKYLYDCQYVEEVVDNMTNELPKALKCKDFDGILMVVDRADAVEVSDYEYAYQKMMYRLKVLDNDILNMQRINSAMAQNIIDCKSLALDLTKGNK